MEIQFYGPVIKSVDGSLITWIKRNKITMEVRVCTKALNILGVNEMDYDHEKVFEKHKDKFLKTVKFHISNRLDVCSSILVTDFELED